MSANLAEEGPRKGGPGSRVLISAGLCARPATLLCDFESGGGAGHALSLGPVAGRVSHQPTAVRPGQGPGEFEP